MSQLFLTAFLVAATLAPHSLAQGPVQIGLSGEIYETAGSMVEIEVVFVPDRGQGTSSAVTLAMHFGWRTSASDVTAVLARRLQDAGAKLLSPGERGASQPVASLFLENAYAVRSRLGYGLNAAITLGENAPASVRLLPPTAQRDGGRLVVGASTLHPHQKNRGRILLEIDINEKDSTARVTGELLQRSIAAGWNAERVDSDAWHPTVTSDGAQITGCSISLNSSAAWMLEVDLPTKRQER